jgi:predicted nucleotidyltransferase
MIHEIKERMADVANLCRRYDVEELHLFGSATSAANIAEVGDLDFLVRFKDAPPARYASNYFGLAEGLAAMFDRRVDLVEHDAIRNPYFRTAVEEQKEPLYGVS